MVKFKSSSCGCPFSQPHLLRNLSFTKMDALGAFVASQLATNLWVLISVTYVIMSGSVSVVCQYHTPLQCLQGITVLWGFFSSLL